MAWRSRSVKVTPLEWLVQLDLDFALGRPQAARTPAVALAGRGVRAALIAGTADEGVELLLDGALDYHPGAELGELRQWALGVADGDPRGQQLVDSLLYLRRRRYGALTA
jgi:hypothetical protein